LAQALGLRLFLIPADLASGGVSGISQLINHYTGWPIGLMVLIGNIPLFLIGWRFLGGRRFGIRTAMAVIAYSFFVDFLVLFLPEHGITDDIFLNSLYGAVVAGFGYGLVYRARYQRRLGHPGAHPQPLARRVHVCQLFDGGFTGYPGSGVGLWLEAGLVCAHCVIRQWIGCGNHP
jgi:hypothetical protein